MSSTAARVCSSACEDIGCTVGRSCLINMGKPITVDKSLPVLRKVSIVLCNQTTYEVNHHVRHVIAARDEVLTTTYKWAGQGWAKQRGRGVERGRRWWHCVAFTIGIRRFPSTRSLTLGRERALFCRCSSPLFSLSSASYGLLRCFQIYALIRCDSLPLLQCFMFQVLYLSYV